MDAEEFEILEEYARAAYEAAARVLLAELGIASPPWEDMLPNVRRMYAAAADAVLDAYDPEWTHNKAGM